MDKRDYHVTIKGVFFNAQAQVLLVQENSGKWDLPGGRLEHGEDFHTALHRECLEEMGIECGILDAHPHWAWSAQNDDGGWKVVLCFHITLPHLNFKASEECVQLAFFDATTFPKADVVLQIQPLGGYLSTVAK